MGILFELFDPLCFSLAAFNICSLCLIFINLITMYLGCILGCFILGLSFLGFPGLGWLLPYPFGGVFNYYLKHFLMAFLSVFFFWGSYDSNVGAFDIVPEVSEFVLISFISFFFFPLCFIYFHCSIFCLSYSTVGSLQSALDLIYCIIWLHSTGVVAVWCWSSSCMVLEQQLHGTGPAMRRYI